MPNLEGISRIKKGSKISRIFRHVFESRKLGRIIGTNITLAIISVSLIPSNAAISVQNEDFNTIQTPLVLPVEKEVRFPVETVKITQGYKTFHPALDLDGTTGDKIYAIMAGIVEAVDYSRFAYGNAVYVNHGGGLSSLYAHLSTINVKEGDEITTNTIIGKMGATGRSFGDHLHLEVRRNGTPVNPLTVLPH